MLFNSLQFLLFFPCVVFAYFLIPHRFRWILLLGASYYFYMCWKPEYVLLIMVSTIIDYYAGFQMGKTIEKVKRKKFLILSLVSNLGILFAFKYFNFFNDSARVLFNHFNIFYNVPAFEILLPIGISFYTFQTLSYTIEVYRGNQKPEKHLGIFALYVTFFPQLVAGPIERSTHLLPQFYKEQRFDYQRVKSGLLLMAWGFLKKIVIADRVGVLVNQVYNNAHDFTGAPLIIATILFAFQVYCDFSGYSDIAIGAAEVMGYRLMKNFNFPYMAKSMSDFWRRWHISLSTWLNDYLYTPLLIQTRHLGQWGLLCSLTLTFFLCGLWHGAAWNFVIFGLLHGVAVSLEVVMKKPIKRLEERVPSLIFNTTAMGLTFGFWCFTLIFFRANSLSDAMYILTHLFTNIKFQFMTYDLGLEINEIIVALVAIIFMELIHLGQRRIAVRVWLFQKPLWLQCFFYYSTLFCFLIFGRFKLETPFIYFQF